MEGSGGGRKMKAPAPLKISRDSRAIRKPPVPLPFIQYRKPVIIHTYSPKVIETDANNFMWLVQRLTGSSDTRLRCKGNKPPLVPSCMPTSPTDQESDLFKPRKMELKWKSEEREMSESSGVSELVGEDDGEQQQQQQQQFRVEQLLVSPTSSSDSGLFNSGSRICAPAMASPKSPLVSFDTTNFQFSGDHQCQHFGAVSSSSESTTNVSSSLQLSAQLQFPWSPIPTPNGISHDILNDFPSLDLWTGGASDGTIGCSPHTGSRLFGAIASPASSFAFRDMASFGFVKDSSS